jgi:predicted CXXCH cytochrome family protein
MKSRSLASTLALVLVCAALPAQAAIDGSPHDLVSQGYAAARTGSSQGQCVLCHVDVVAADAALFPELPPSLSARYDAATLNCFSCHDGITLVSPEVDASQTAFHSASHAGAPAMLLAPQTPEEGSAGAGCATCHDPHENRHRPFLRAPVAALCLACHTAFNEIAMGQRNTTGSHPVGIEALSKPRPEVPIIVGPPFKIPYPSAYPIQQGRTSTGTHWDLGGHLSAGIAGEIVCATCHAVHGDEERPPAPGLPVVDPVRQVADQLCEGCHRGLRGDGGAATVAPNPGGTTTGRTYHPCDDDAANGPGRIVEIRTPAGWPFGDGSPPRLLCSTCHAPHRAQPGTSLLRRPESAASFCGECHDRTPAEYHHATGASTGPCASSLPAGAEGTAPQITCDLCHRAHNAGLGTGREADFVPQLRVDLTGDTLCLSCHPADNPSCSQDPLRKSSHFLGDPTLPETFDDMTPPLRADAWPESGLKSRFGGENGKSILCLSCHTFKKGGVVSGDDGKRRHLLARAGNLVELNPGEETVYLCTGCHSANPGKENASKGRHPLMEADMAKLGTPPRPPLTGTPSGHINCDSCHRSHGAHTPSGVYMLEMVEGENTDPRAIKPKIDFTPTCHGCHDPGKY